jgi:DNA primase
MNLVQTPLSRMADRVSEYYAAHPDLIVALLEFIGGYQIKHRAGQIRCTCPLHGGNNPDNFAVWFDKGVPVWRCMSDCANKGTLSRLIMTKYNASFEQAVVWLANRAGLQVAGDMLQVSKKTLEEEDVEAFKRRMGLTGQEQPNYFPESWVQFSQQNLYAPASAEFLDYLTGPLTERTRWGDQKRQMPPQIVAHFQLGFVPARHWTWKDTVDPSITRGWMENRISFPWRDINGHCIGFAGRRVDAIKDQKYKTLPGTKRSLALWWLHDPLCKQAIMRTRVLHMLEGYTDVMRAYQHQCYNATAIGGTELTTQQLTLLKAFHLDHVVMYLDPDGPGMVAASKIAQQLQRTTCVKLATPPSDLDPAELIDFHQFWTPIVQARPFIPKE